MNCLNQNHKFTVSIVWVLGLFTLYSALVQAEPDNASVFPESYISRCHEDIIAVSGIWTLYEDGEALEYRVYPLLSEDRQLLGKTLTFHQNCYAARRICEERLNQLAEEFLDRDFTCEHRPLLPLPPIIHMDLIRP